MKLPLVLSVAVVMLTALPAAADSSAEWALDAGHYQSSKIWEISRGAGVTVAVVDSGVDAKHPDLVGQVLPGASLLGNGGDGRTDTSSDSHGTAVAALIAGTGASDHGQGIIGLAPGAKVLPVQVSVDGDATAPLLAQGIIWAAGHGAQVINVSMGTPDADPLLAKAVAYAEARNIVVVASAGNDGEQGDPPMYPAAFKGVVSVSGVDESGQFWPQSESGTGITLAAPAAGIDSASDTGRYVQADGTSYAAAYVSAAAALVRSRFPQLTAGQVIQRLIDTADHHHAVPDAQFGYGLLDPYAALTAHVDTTSTANPLLNPPQAQSSGSILPLVLGVGGGALAIVLGAGLVVLRRRRRRPTAAAAPPFRANRPVRPAAKKKKPASARR